jgi:hypothetical protein
MSIWMRAPAWPLHAWEAIPLGVAALAWSAVLAWFDHEVRSALRLLAPIATPRG